MPAIAGAIYICTCEVWPLRPDGDADADTIPREEVIADSVIHGPVEEGCRFDRMGTDVRSVVRNIEVVITSVTVLADKGASGADEALSLSEVVLDGIVPLLGSDSLDEAIVLFVPEIEVVVSDLEDSGVERPVDARVGCRLIVVLVADEEDDGGIVSDSVLYVAHPMPFQ